MIIDIRKLTIVFLLATNAFSSEIEDRVHTTINAITGSDIHLSHEKRDFDVLTIKNSYRQTYVKEKFFLIQGGLHGDEKLTSEFVLWLAKRMKENRSLLNQLPKNVVIDFLPYANPDNYQKHRYNANNVNLNRNFSVLWGISTEPNGHKPFSEPETKAIQSLMQSRQYISAIDVHGYVPWIVAPSPPKHFASAPPLQKLRYNLWYEALKNGMSMLKGYELQNARDLGDGGSFEDWAFWTNNTLSFCLEMSHSQRLVHYPNQPEIDTYHSYEKYIYHMFQSALSIKKQIENKSIIANNP